MGFNSGFKGLIWLYVKIRSNSFWQNCVLLISSWVFCIYCILLEDGHVGRNILQRILKKIKLLCLTGSSIIILDIWSLNFAVGLDNILYFQPINCSKYLYQFLCQKNFKLVTCIFSKDVKVKVKIKCTLVQALRLCTGRTAHRRSRGIALLFHDHGTRRGWGVSVTLRPLFTAGKDPVPIVQEAGWALWPVWTGAGNLAPNGIRSP